MPDEPNRAKGIRTGPLHVPLAYSLALHHRARHPEPANRLVMNGEDSGIENRQSRRSGCRRNEASSEASEVDFRDHAKRGKDDAGVTSTVVESERICKGTLEGSKSEYLSPYWAHQA